MHECVLSAKKQMENHISALDIAKQLIDRGFHPPTVYFPLIVKEAMMIEPTETESKEALDLFIDTMKDLAQNATKESEFESFHLAPVTTPVGRLDEVKAVKDMDFSDI
jgi:glycine dehydrogenase subunit 2